MKGQNLKILPSTDTVDIRKQEEKHKCSAYEKKGGESANISFLMLLYFLVSTVGATKFSRLSREMYSRIISIYLLYPKKKKIKDAP